MSNDCLAAFRSAILKAHNSYRSQHRAPALTEDATVGATAQKYATYLADKTLFQHSGTKGLGENLAASSSFSAPSVADCTS